MSQPVDTSLALNPDRFKLALVAKRVEAHEQALSLSDAHDFEDLPVRVHVRVGNQVYKHLTSDLILDTGNRFIHSICESCTRGIELNPSDVPDSSAVFQILALQAPGELTTTQLVSVIKGLSYINASDALDVMSSYLPEKLDSSTVTALLAAVVQHSVTSSLLQHLCQALDTAFGSLQLDAVLEFWQLMAPFADAPLCHQLEECSGPVGQWLWRSLAAIVCGGECPTRTLDEDAYLPTQAALPASDLLSHFLHMCGSRWCECRSQLVLSLFTHSRLPSFGGKEDKPAVVSLTAQSVTLAVKVPRLACNTSQEIRVRLSGTYHKFSIQSGPCCVDGGAVRGHMSAYLHYSDLQPGTVYDVTFSLFAAQDAWPLLSGHKAACKMLGQPGTGCLPHWGRCWGFVVLPVAQDDDEDVLVCVEIRLSS